jgi:hypothetical protein
MTVSMKDKLLDTRSEWWGHLTLENIEPVFERMKKVLTEKRYTWVAVNELYGTLPRPEVRTSQQLEPGKSTSGQGIYLHYGEEKDWAMIGVNDTYGSWSISTDRRPEKRPYLYFQHDKITIEHYAPGGNKLIWVVAVERDQQEYR